MRLNLSSYWRHWGEGRWGPALHSLIRPCDLTQGDSEKDKNDSEYHLIPSCSCWTDGRFLKTPSLLSEKKIDFVFPDENYVFQQLLMEEQGNNAKLVCIWHEVLASETGKKSKWTKKCSHLVLLAKYISFFLLIHHSWPVRMMGMEANSWRDMCQSLWVLPTNNLLRAPKNGLMEYLPICTQQTLKGGRKWSERL